VVTPPPRVHTPPPSCALRPTTALMREQGGSGLAGGPAGEGAAALPPADLAGTLHAVQPRHVVVEQHDGAPPGGEGVGRRAGRNEPPPQNGHWLLDGYCALQEGVQNKNVLNELEGNSGVAKKIWTPGPAEPPEKEGSGIAIPLLFPQSLKRGLKYTGKALAERLLPVLAHARLRRGQRSIGKEPGRSAQKWE